jgi:hypothetical protein
MQPIIIFCCPTTSKMHRNRLPDSVFKAHLAPKGTPTALIKISGGPTSAVAIQKLMERICPLSS